jgi:hypothetical protein
MEPFSPEPPAPASRSEVASSAPGTTLPAPDDGASQVRATPPHWADAPVPADPERVGKYAVVARLGRGGQAATYKAWDPDLKRHVVLKLYHAAGTSEQQDAVLREGQALARVRSPYVARVHAVERQPTCACLVVEYLPGRTLAERLRAGPVRLDEALELTARLAEGLAAVHACGLLHRDVKPGNVLVGDDGLPRLIDFGLARPLGDDALRRISGTLAYMAPEQARGEIDRVDPRTDVFGLGAVLYELLTGRPPYRAETAAELLEQARAGDVAPPRTHNPRLPAAINDTCLRCLAKDPDRRYASAADLARAVRGWQRRRRAVPVAVMAFAAVAALAVWLGRPAPPSVGPATASVEPSAARDPDGRPLRQDFPLKVDMVGAPPGPDGLRHITEGQLLSFRLEPSVNCYVGIWHRDAEGKVTQLFPNEHDPNHLIPGGTTRAIPGDKNYQIVARPEKAPGHVHVLASTTYWSTAAGRKAGPYVVFATPEELEQFRNFEIETKTKAVSEHVFAVRVEPR